MGALIRRLILALAGCLGPAAFAFTGAALVDAARDAEARHDAARALELYRRASEADPGNAFLHQKVARQYSDLVLEQPTTSAKRAWAESALHHAQRAVELDPHDPVNVLSVAICYGKLAVYGDTRTKVRNSRLVRERAERALALDPGYAWAHHVLGRWHREVASLSGAASVYVRLFYGGLPPASKAEAVRHLEQAAALEPGELNHHLELGFAYAAAGRHEEARSAWTRGLAMPDRGRHDAPAKQRARAALGAL